MAMTRTSSTHTPLIKRTVAGTAAGISLLAVGVASLAPLASASAQDSVNTMNGRNMTNTMTMPNSTNAMNDMSDQMYASWWQNWMNNWNNSQNNGSSWNNDQAYNAFMSGFNTINGNYRNNVRSNLNQTYYRIGNGDTSGLYTFYNRFQADNARFDQMVTQAGNNWRNSWGNGSDKARPRNTFLDAFNNAKAMYYNDLNQAKDQLSSDLNKANQASAKDGFMNNFNNWTAKSGSQLEELKNMLAQRSM